ncbi:flagellar hook-length control protein FliK, partial [Massilia arenosa]
MKPVAGADAVRPAVPVSDARQEAFDRSMSSLLGQSVKGEVLAKLNDGTSLVRVAGNSVRMPLPEGAQVGAHVPLTLVSLSPRPTFEVGGQPGGVEAHIAYSAAGLPDGAAHEPLVYLDTHGVPTRAGQATTGTPIQAALPTA